MFLPTNESHATGYINGIKSYSQYCQDYWVLSLLNWKREGFFIECGCADGAFLSNTFLMENEYNWSGILCEPDDKQHEKAYRLRKNPVFHGCVFTHSNGVNFTENELLGAISNHGAPKASITWKELLTKYNAPNYVDYLSLDTEGYELELLQAFPWDEYKVGVITVEHSGGLHLTWAKRQLLARHGYEFVYDNGCDDCFALPELIKGAAL